MRDIGPPELGNTALGAQAWLKKNGFVAPSQKAHDFISAVYVELEYSRLAPKRLTLSEAREIAVRELKWVPQL